MPSSQNNPEYLPEHPISEARARELLAGDLGKVHLEILRDGMAPICWAAKAGDLAGATLTIAKTPKRLLGITARHVLAQYFEDRKESGSLLRIMNTYLIPTVISESARLDIVTIELTDKILNTLGVERRPIPTQPSHRPQEGRGIMLSGYPAFSREVGEDSIGFGMFTAIGMARRVTDRQITWVPDREDRAIDLPGITPLPPQSELGGISGGPVLAWYENAGVWFAYYSLAGIITEANALTECVVASRADYIRDDGSIREPA